MNSCRKGIKNNDNSLKNIKIINSKKIFTKLLPFQKKYLRFDQTFSQKNYIK